MTTTKPGAARAESVASAARRILGELTTSERKVARALLSAYPVAGLETVAQLGERAGVSPPTVVRFVSRLGFSGYPDFQRNLLREVHEQLGSPLEQYAEKGNALEGSNFLPRISANFSEGITSSFAEVPETEFLRAVELLCDERCALHLAGGRFSQVLASYLASHLQQLRRGVSLVPSEEIAQLALVADGGKAHTLIVFDYRRYEVKTVRLAQLMAKNGAHVILLTDRWLSPVADVADVVLPVRVEAPSPFDSLVPAMALVESLIAAVVDRLGDRGLHRLQRIERDRATLSQGDSQNP